MARKIVITSGKGGAGKTTVCANLGIALARLCQRVLLMDLDIGLNNLDVVMQVEDKVVFDFIDVVENRCRPSQALIQDESEPTLYVMPSCKLSKRQVTADAVKKVIARLSESFDYILIDCPAGLDVGFRRAISCADEAIVVVTPHLSGVRDADKTIAELQRQAVSVSVVVNRVRGDLVASGEMLSAFEVFSLLGHTALGVIPENDEVNCNIKLHASRKAFDLLAKNLKTGEFDMYDCVSAYKGLFGKLKRKFKRNV
ncbi:MAG: septum site-determining protein MinD [Corallococcus sp.]|nr:septum site-determining protein MinD [Corallococcus sp.]